MIAFAVLSATLGSADRADAQVPPEPLPGCATIPLPCIQGNGKLTLDVAGRVLAWKWTGGGIVDISDVSNPTVSDRYDFCIYDTSDVLVLSTGVPAAGICSGRPCWRARPWGFQYRDRSGLIGGITKIMLKPVSRRRDRFSVQAAGAQLPMPAAEPTPPLTVQLVRTHEYTGEPEACWTSTAATLR